MSRIKNLAILAVIFSMVAANAQETNPEFMARLRENPFRSGVNTCPYEWGPYADTPAPKGYKPFYISHYGRHGSRSNWDERTYQQLIGTLEKADGMGILTADGKTLLDVTRQCLEKHNGMDGRLTPRGVREHRGIAERMYRRFPEVFKKGSRNVRAISSNVPRCLVSMVGFTDRLTELDPGLEMSWDTGETYMLYIDPKVTANFQRESWMESARLPRLQVDSVAYMSRFFTDTGKAFELVRRFPSFEGSVYAVARITASFDIDTDIFPMLPEESIYNSWASNNVGLYLGQANSARFGDLRMPPAGETVKDIIDKADAVIAGEKVDADLRFGHDYPLVAMCSYFGVEGVGQVLPTNEVSLKWFGSDFTPFAGNLQLIFYRNGKGGDVLVKFLMNEREASIYGVEPVSGPYYRWADIKAAMAAKAAGYAGK